MWTTQLTSRATWFDEQWLPKSFFFFSFWGRLSSLLSIERFSMWTGRLSMTWFDPRSCGNTFPLGTRMVFLFAYFFFVPELFRGFLRLNNVRQWKIVEVKKVDSVGWGVKDRFIWLHTIWCDVQVEELYLNPFKSIVFGCRFVANNQQRRRGSRQVRMCGRKFAGHWNIQRIDSTRQRWVVVLI